MRKILLIIPILSFLSGFAYGQDEPGASIVHWGSVTELQAINPAYFGEQDAMVFDAKTDIHITSVSPDPFRFKLSFDSHIEKWNSGIGLNLGYMSNGFRNLRIVNLNWNAKIKFSEMEAHHLRFGITAGAVQNSVFMDKNDLVYPRPSGKDQLEIFATESFFRPDIRIGFWYRNKNLFAGLAIHDIIPLNVNRLTGINNGNKEILTPEIHLNAGYAFELSEAFHLMGQFNFRYHRMGIDWQPLIRAIIRNRLMIGTGISDSRIHVEAGIRFLRVARIHYGYGYWYRGMNGFTQGTHSIGIKVGIF